MIINFYVISIQNYWIAQAVSFVTIHKITSFY